MAAVLPSSEKPRRGCITVSARSGGPFHQKRKHIDMNIHLSLTPLISLVAGVLILVMPRLLNYIVAIYLIVIGLIGLFGTGNLFR